MSDSKTILVVDDDLDVVAQLEAILGGAGYEVATASGREEAEELLLTVQPDLAIVDLMMEHMDAGFFLAHNLRKLYPGTPVILLTGVRAVTGLSFAAQSESARSWLKADKVLDKPVRREQLLAEVGRLLKRAGESPRQHPPG